MSTPPASPAPVGTGQPTVRPAPRPGTYPDGIVDSAVTSVFDVWSSVVRHSVDYWCGALGRGATPFDVAADVLELEQRRHPSRAADVDDAAHRRPRVAGRAAARLLPGAPARQGRRGPGPRAAAAGGPRLVHRRLRRRPVPDPDGARRGSDPGAVPGLGRRDPGDEGRGRRGVPRGDARGGRRPRRPRPPRRRLPGRLARGDLHRAAPADRGDADDRGRAGRLPRRGAAHPRLDPAAVAGRPDGLLPRARRGRRRRAARRGAARRFQGDAAAGRDRPPARRPRAPRRPGAIVARYATFENWFQHTQPIPGAFYLWIVEHLFQRNELVAGTLVVEGRIVDLSAISCPLYLLAGSSDHITPPPQVFALADFASTPADDVTRLVVPGGHLGLFMGHEALRGHWAPVFAAVAARD